jgi:Macrocin-O-methyltransferase (TylF)
MTAGEPLPRGQGDASKFKSVLLRLDHRNMRFDQGYGHTCTLPPAIPPGDSEDAPFRSSARLFENGLELGPRHVPHDQIRALGGGRYSHYGTALFFAARDNTSPIKNRREYHLLVPASMFVPHDTWPLETDLLALDELAPMQRFAVARTVYRKIWRHTPLPDHGRRIDHDESFAREFARVCPGNDVTHERKYNLDQLFQLVSRVAGDVAECGVYNGASACFLARHIVAGQLGKRLCLFDSFQGLSAPADIDGDYWHAGALASEVDVVKAALALLGPVPFVEFYKGWIPDRFPEVADRRFCFVHIDVDLYQPTLDSISFFYPRLESGGMILLDDYGFQSSPGVTAAVDEFMSGKPEPIVNLASGGALIMKGR